MARHRIDSEITTLKSWDEVDQAVREIGEHDARIEHAEAKLTKQVNELKENAENTARPWQENRELLLRQVEEFCKRNKRDFGGKKSLELNYGVVGFRRSTRLRVKKVAETLAELKLRAMESCIRIKEGVNKDALGELDDETLGELGVTRKIVNTFYAEPDREQVQAVEA